MLSVLCDCEVSGHFEKPRQHGADPHAKNCVFYQKPEGLRWTDRSPEERQRILDTPITFGYIGGRSHAGSGVFESWLPGDRPGKKSAVVQSDERFSPDTEDPKGDE